MTPKVCMLLTTDEDGQQKYIEISQQQALALSNGGTVSMVQASSNFPSCRGRQTLTSLLSFQGTVSSGQTQYILADQANFKTTAFDGGGHLIAYPQSGGGLAQEVEMVQYVDNTGQELSQVGFWISPEDLTEAPRPPLSVCSPQEDVQYYALDGQEYSVIQANEEIVVSTEPRLQHEEQHLQQSQAQGAQAAQAIVIESVSPPKSKGGRATVKRKNSPSTDTAKTYARGRGGGTVSATVVNSAQGRSAPSSKKLVIVDEDHQHYSVNKVQSLHLSNGTQMAQVPVSTISFVTQGGQTHQV
jgi:hypothetical protein